MKPIRILSKGALIPGIGVEITVKEDHFVHPGELQLFARVLSEFFASYASINSCVQLAVTMEPSHQKIIFDPVFGERCQL